MERPKRRFSRRTRVNNRAQSTRGRGRSRFPLRGPTGLHRPAPGRRRLSEREGNEPAACSCPKAVDFARSPRTSRADARVAVFAGRPSSPETAGAQTPGGSQVESTRSYREIALAKYPAPWVRRCNRRPGRPARRPSRALPCRIRRSNQASL